MKYYPVYLNLKGRRVLVVGAGPVASQKLPALIGSESHVHVIAPDAVPEIRGLARDGKIKWSSRFYRKTDIQGASLVIAATDDPALQKKIVRDARAHRIWVNVVDVPTLCDFIAPAVIDRGDIQIAISTGGAAPALAKYLRRKLEPIIGKEYAEFAKILRKMRPDILKLPKDRRVSFWERVVSDAFFEEVRQGGIAAAENRVKELAHAR